MKTLLTLSLLILGMAHSLAFDIKLMANNKEAFSRQITRRDRQELNYWLSTHPKQREEIVGLARTILAKTMMELVKRSRQCDLGLAQLLVKNGHDLGLILERDEVYPMLTLLREENIVDDIFYKLAVDAADVQRNLDQAAAWQPRGRVVESGENLEELYSEFRSWPDDLTHCTLGSYSRMVKKLSGRNARERDGRIYQLNRTALARGTIDALTFSKLEVLRRSAVLDWPVFIQGYLEIIQHAKDKLATDPEHSTSHALNQRYSSRREGLTRRGRLYMTFDSTQIIMLSNLLEKTARRMDARRVQLNWYFDRDEDLSEIYVLSPMEQYRVAVKLLRKDMAELMRSEAFRGTGVIYEDIISAAFETGVLKSDELDEILKFEEFWKPKASRWKAMSNFSFSLAGTASFFMPPPFNFIGAVGLIFAQSQLFGDGKPDPEDNWNVII
jgi:hypothetical protein